MKKSSRFRVLVMILLGATLLLSKLVELRIAAPDVLKLVGSGMLLGMGVASLMGRTVQRVDRS